MTAKDDPGMANYGPKVGQENGKNENMKENVRSVVPDRETAEREWERE